MTSHTIGLNFEHGRGFGLKIVVRIRVWPGRKFPTSDPIRYDRKQYFFPGIPADSKQENDGTDRKYTVGIEAVFRIGNCRTGTSLFQRSSVTKMHSEYRRIL